MHSSDFEITYVITPCDILHLVQLLLLITIHKSEMYLVGPWKSCYSGDGLHYYLIFVHIYSLVCLVDICFLSVFFKISFYIISKEEHETPGRYDKYLKLEVIREQSDLTVCQISSFLPPPSP